MSRAFNVVLAGALASAMMMSSGCVNLIGEGLRAGIVSGTQLIIESLLANAAGVA